MPKLGRDLSGAVVAIGDQVTASLTSIATVVLAARELTLEDFSWFSLIYVSAALLVGIARAWLGEPYLVLLGAGDSRERAIALSIGLKFWRSIAVAGSAVAAIAYAVGQNSDLMLTFAASVVLLSALGLADSVRFWFVGTRRAPIAIGFGLLTLCIAVAWMSLVAPSTLPGVLVSFAVSFGAMGLGANAFATRLVSRDSGPIYAGERVREWKAHDERRAHSRNFAVEFGVGSGGYYAATLVSSALVGISAAAGIRGSESLLGPIRIVVSVLPNAVLATADRDLTARAVTTRISALVTVVALISYGVAIGAFAVTGSWLFGASSTVVGDVLPLLGLAPVFMAVSTGAVIGLRAMGRSDITVRIRAAAATFPLAGAVVGSTGGVAGIAAGLALASACASVLWWLAYLRVGRTDGPKCSSPVTSP